MAHRIEFNVEQIGLIEAGLRQGRSLRYLGRLLGVSHETIRRTARLLVRPRPEDCEVVMPVNGLFRHSEPTPIRPGDYAYCAVSDRTGVDDHPALRKPREVKKTSGHKFRPKGLGKAAGSPR